MSASIAAVVAVNTTVLVLLGLGLLCTRGYRLMWRRRLRHAGRFENRKSLKRRLRRILSRHLHNPDVLTAEIREVKAAAERLIADLNALSAPNDTDVLGRRMRCVVLLQRARFPAMFAPFEDLMREPGRASDPDYLLSVILKGELKVTYGLLTACRLVLSVTETDSSLLVRRFRLATGNRLALDVLGYVQAHGSEEEKLVAKQEVEMVKQERRAKLVQVK